MPRPDSILANLTLIANDAATAAIAWERAARGPAATTALGVAMIAFGWLYPHFLTFGPVTRYLVAAPMGLIPCPTLSLVIGFALLAGGLSSRAWSIVLAVVGLFYGLFGACRTPRPTSC